MQSIYIGSHSLARTVLKNADSVIEPRAAYIGPADFHHARECILQGKLAAEDRIPELKRQLLRTWRNIEGGNPWSLLFLTRDRDSFPVIAFLEPEG
jgi:hypothetical protein